MIDPTKIRVSEHFLLSDFMMCHSMAINGYKNEFLDPKKTKIEEISWLCESILEPILAEKGPISISYGHISDELSRNIVKYQDPAKPSYHRWDAGAAVDICVHDHVLQGEDGAPIYLAFDIDCKYEYSRMITYSESPYVCIATRVSEKGDTPRKAFYENRFMGKVKTKPLYLSKPASASKREEEASRLVLEHPWQGTGYPTYHGGGIRQAQHVRLADYAMLLDFLYSTECVNYGATNIPSPDRETRKYFYRAGRAFTALLKAAEVKRLSIVRAFESPLSFDRSPYNWKDGFIFQVVPPEGVNPNDIADAAQGLDTIHTVGVDRRSRIVTIAGM